jgi:hypothetical protein
MTSGTTIEAIRSGERTLTLIVRAEIDPPSTTFVTPPQFPLQVGFVVYPSSGKVDRHFHLPLERHIVGTAEVLVVRRGRCEMDVYDDERKLVSTRELRTGDVVVMVGGGHGFRMLEDTTLLEVKQGPYTGLDEKTRF